MSVLLAHEKKGGATMATNAVKTVIPQESSDSSDNDDVTEIQPTDTGKTVAFCRFVKDEV